MTEKGINGTGKKQDIMERAAGYLAYKMRTRQEVCRYLAERGYAEEEIQSCADEMEEYHLIDDLEYSRLYIETGLEHGKGMDRIRRELRGKGVKEDVIEDSQLLLEEIPQEYDMALSQALDAVRYEDLRGMDYQGKEKLKGRIARRLAGRGFRTDTIYGAVREAFRQREEEQESEE